MVLWNLIVPKLCLCRDILFCEWQGKRESVREKTSGATKSPTQSQALKKAKLLDLASRESSDCESEYTDAEDTEEIPEKVSTINMAVNENYASPDLEEAVIKVLKNPDVVKTLIAAIRSEIRASFKQELEEKDKQIRDLRTELENKTDDLEMYGRRNGVSVIVRSYEVRDNTIGFVSR